MRKDEFFEDEEFHKFFDKELNFIENYGIIILLCSFVLSIIHLL